MSVTTTPISSGLASNIVKDSALGGTADNDIRNGATTVYVVSVDNSANAAASYVKLYNNAAPTVGTTAPDIILMCPSSVKREFWVGGGLGISFGTACSMACVTTGGTAGTTSPSSSVIVNVFSS